MLDRTFTEGEPHTQPAQRVLLPAGDRLVEHWFAVGYSPLHDADGAVSGLFIHAVETTEQVLAAQRAEFLAQLGRALQEVPLRPAEVAGRAVELIAPRLADRCEIDLAGDPAPHSPAACGHTLAVPLTAHGRELGTLRLYADERDRFTGPDLILVNEAAAAVATSLDNAQLHAAQLHGLRETEAARARGAALQQLAEALSQAPTPAAIGELAATRAAGLLGADAASLYTPRGADMEMVHSTGWSDEVARRYRLAPLHRGRPMSDAVLDVTPVWLEDAAQWHARYPEVAPVHSGGGYEASAFLPLRVEGRDLGALVFSFLEPRSFPPDEREYLLAVAALCAQALDRARLLVAEQDARATAEKERDRMAFLAEASLLLDAPMSVEERMQRLTDLAVPGVADWCAVTLVEDDRVEQVAVAHSDPAKIAFVQELQDRYPSDPDAPGGAIQVARTGVPSLVPEISEEMLVAAAHDETHLELVRAIGLRSAMVVPLRVRGRGLGSLTLVNAESDQLFGPADLAFAQALAGRAALALDNADLYERQRTIASTLQTALLPAVLPTVPGVRLAARYLPQSHASDGVQVGGDLYDVFAGDGPGEWSVVVADVCGKGPAAAALTALIRYTLRAEVSHGLAPAAALRRLNAEILRHGDPSDARFVTVAHAALRVHDAGATLALASGGHPPALLLRGATVEAVEAGGTLLGVFTDPEATDVEVRLDRGDTLLLYTDGVTEARGPDGLYGAERLASLLSRLRGP